MQGHRVVIRSMLAMLAPDHVLRSLKSSEFLSPQERSRKSARQASQMEFAIRHQKIASASSTSATSFE